MFTNLWNWLFQDQTKTQEKIHYFLLSKSVRHCYLRQKQAASNIQAWFRRYSLEKNNEENLFLEITRLQMKNNQLVIQN